MGDRIDFAQWGGVIVELVRRYVNTPGAPRRSAEHLAALARGVVAQLIERVPQVSPRDFQPATGGEGLYEEMMSEIVNAMVRADPGEEEVRDER